MNLIVTYSLPTPKQLRAYLSDAILEKQLLLAETDNRLGQAIEESLISRCKILNLTAETLYNGTGVNR